MNNIYFRFFTCRKKVVIFAFPVIFILLTAFQIKPDTIEEQKNLLIKEGVKLVYSAQYSEAIQHFRKLEEIDPDCFEGEFFEVFILELMMDIYRSQVFDDSLSAVVERALERAHDMTEENPTARKNMFLGGLYGVRGVRKGILGHWLGAALDGRRAFKYMEKSVWQDTANYDCYYGIGSYHYWRSRKLRKFFPFLADERQMGIDELYLSIDKGIFARTPSRMALFRIFIEEEQYQNVIELADMMIAENPDHIFPRWYYGIALIKLRKWKKAIENYTFISNYLESVPYSGIEADIEANYYLGLAYFNLKEYRKSQEYLKNIPKYIEIVNKNLFYYDDYIEESADLLKKIDKALASGS